MVAPIQPDLFHQALKYSDGRVSFQIFMIQLAVVNDSVLGENQISYRSY